MGVSATKVPCVSNSLLYRGLLPGADSPRLASRVPPPLLSGTPLAVPAPQARGAQTPQQPGGPHPGGQLRTEVSAEAGVQAAEHLPACAQHITSHHAETSDAIPLSGVLDEPGSIWPPQRWTAPICKSVIY